MTVVTFRACKNILCQLWVNYIYAKLLCLQGCTIFSIFVTAHLLWQFVPSKNLKSIPKLQIRQQDKRFDDENVVLALFILCSLHSWSNSNMADLEGHAWEKVETWFVIKYAFYVYYFYDHSTCMFSSRRGKEKYIDCLRKLYIIERIRKIDRGK